MTNIYEMPCTPFIGINRHGQTFQLGCAFIRNEKVATYEWLFVTFLEAMDGKAPLNIITDQDAAMRATICTVFSKHDSQELQVAYHGQVFGHNWTDPW